MDPKKLTREEKLALLEVAQEKKRRELLQKPQYTPNKGQLPIHQSKAAQRFVFSGNGAGKTAAMVHEVMWAAQGYNPITKERSVTPVKIGITVDDTKKIDEVMMKELRKWFTIDNDSIKKNGKTHTDKVFTKEGSEISFYTAKSDPLIFEGTEYDYQFVDEPIDQNLYIALLRSLRVKGRPNKFFFSGTAIGQQWLRSRIYEPWTKGETTDIECFKVSSDVNMANMDAAGVKAFRASMTQEQLEVRVNGGFFDAGSLALAHLWSRDHHIIKTNLLEWNQNWPVVIGVDPHPVKKHVAVMVGATPDNRLVVLKELSRKLTAREYAFELMKWMSEYRVVDIVCDSLGSTEGTGNEGFLTFIEVVNQTLRNNNCPGIRPTRYEEKSHEDLIDRLQTGLLLPEVADNFGKKIAKLRVVASCTGVIENIESVGWLKAGNSGEYKPKLDTASKDFLSALGYALAANVRFDRGRERVITLKKAPYRGLSLKSQRR